MLLLLSFILPQNHPYLSTTLACRFPGLLNNIMRLLARAFILEVPQWHTFHSAQGQKVRQMGQTVHLAHQVSAEEPPPCCLLMLLWYYPLHIATSVNKTKRYVWGMCPAVRTTGNIAELGYNYSLKKRVSFTHLVSVNLQTNACCGWKLYYCTSMLLGSLSSDVLERRMSTRSGLFALLSCDFEQIFGKIVSIRMKTLGNTNMVDMRHSKMALLKLPNHLTVSLASV